VEKHFTNSHVESNSLEDQIFFFLVIALFQVGGFNQQIESFPQGFGVNITNNQQDESQCFP